MRYGSSARDRPRDRAGARSIAPPLMSPPTRLRLRASKSAGVDHVRARGRGRGSPGAKRSTCDSIASVRSPLQPFGTWQYAQAVCLPSGARVGSKSVCWARSTNGRSAGAAGPGARSEAAISSSVPPRWTVAARGAPRRAPRDRPVERPVELERAGPVAVAARARGRSAREAAAIRRSSPGATSARTTSAARQLVDRARDVRSRRRARAGARRARRRSPARRRAGSRQPATWPSTREREPEAGARPPLERQHRVRRAAGEERARALGRERRLGERARVASAARDRAARAAAPARARTRRRERPEDERLDSRPRADDRPDQRAVRGGVGAEVDVGEVALEHDRACRRRTDARRARAGRPTATSSAGPAEERRGAPHRVDRRAEVVTEARQRQLGGADAAAERVAPPRAPRRRAPPRASVSAPASPFGPEPTTTASIT